MKLSSLYFDVLLLLLREKSKTVLIVNVKIQSSCRFISEASVQKSLKIRWDFSRTTYRKRFSINKQCHYPCGFICCFHSRNYTKYQRSFISSETFLKFCDSTKWQSIVSTHSVDNQKKSWVWTRNWKYRVCSNSSATFRSASILPLSH